MVNFDMYAEAAGSLLSRVGLSGGGHTRKSEKAPEASPERVQFRKFDGEKRLVYAEVYAPDLADAHGDFMTAEQIEKMAHNFMRSGATHSVDVNHDHDTSRGCYIVESFIARSHDPDYIPGAWVAAIHVPHDELWKAIKSGKITGFSFEGLGQKHEIED